MAAPVCYSVVKVPKEEAGFSCGQLVGWNGPYGREVICEGLLT